MSLVSGRGGGRLVAINSEQKVFDRWFYQPSLIVSFASTSNWPSEFKKWRIVAALDRVQINNKSTRMSQTIDKKGR